MKKSLLNYISAIIFILFMVISVIPIRVLAGDSTPERKDSNFLAKGTHLYIDEGTDSGKTVVYYMNGSTKVYLNQNGAKGEDLSSSVIHGGDTNEQSKDVHITMLGGKVNGIYGGCFHPDSSPRLNGNVTIEIHGGEVTTLCSAFKGEVNGNVNLMITDGKIETVYVCPWETSVHIRGNANIVVCGGTVGSIVGDMGSRPIDGTTSGCITNGNIYSGASLNSQFDNLFYKNKSSLTLIGDFSIPDNVTVTVASEETITIPTNVVLPNDGTIINNGTLIISSGAKIENKGKIINNGKIVFKDGVSQIANNAVVDNGDLLLNYPYITGVSSVDEIKVNGNVITGTTTVLDGKLFLNITEKGYVFVKAGHEYYYGYYNGEAIELKKYTYVTGLKVSLSEMEANIAYDLQTTVYPVNALTQHITYEITDAGTTGAVLSGNKITASYPGDISLKVTAKDSYAAYVETVTVKVKHIPVTGINGTVPSNITAATVDLPTEVLPDNASYKKIVWSVASGPAVVSGNQLKITGAGTIKLLATVKDGLGIGIDYTKEYTTTVEIQVRDYDIANGSIIFTNDNGNIKVTQGNHEASYIASDLIRITGTTDSNTITVSSGAPRIILKDCNISTTDKPIVIAPNASLDMVLAGENTLTGSLGIDVPYRAKLTIDGIGDLQVTGTKNAGIGADNDVIGNVIINGGNITATGQYEGAPGIGNKVYNRNSEYSKITINGGNVTAAGGRNAAAIGGGGITVSGGTITINGGNVNATGGSGSYTAGIGNYGSYYKDKYTNIIINGGNITATGGQYAAGIGGGSSSCTIGNITITGGTITSTGSVGIGNATTIDVTGGNIKGGVSGKELKTITLNGLTSEEAVTALDGVTYGIKDVKTLDTNKLYFYLPSDNADAITVDNTKYICNRNLIYYTTHSENGYSNITEETHDEICSGCSNVFNSGVIHNYGDDGNCICGYNNHTHKWEYVAEGNAITEKCVEPNCTIENAAGGSITITAPADLTYTGNEKEAVITNTITTDDTYTVTYGPTDSKPVDAGTYTATLSIGNAQVSIEYTIKAADITIKADDNSKLYGAAEEPELTWSIVEGSLKGNDTLTDITVSRESGEMAGEYPITVSQKEGVNPNYNINFQTGIFTIKDETKPTGEIVIKESSWKQFINWASFGLFYKNNVDVIVHVDGTGSAIAKVEYLFSNTALEENNVPTDGWTELNDNHGYKFAITKQNKGAVYVRITDAAGNAAIINSEGIVVYEDSTMNENKLYYTYKSSDDVIAELVLNGNTVKNVLFDGHEIANYWSVDGNKLKLHAEYLSGLEVLDEGNGYPVTICFNPMGEATDTAADMGNVEFSLVVQKAEGSVTNISDISKIYDGTAVYNPTYTALSDGTAAIEYKRKGADDSTYTTEAPSEAGDYVVRVTVAEGHSYKESSATAEFTISEASLRDISVAQKGTLTYTGGAQAAEVTTKAAAYGGQNVTFIYSTEENGTYGTMPEFTDAGDYTVYYKASAPSHEDTYGSFTVTVVKAVVTEPTIASKIYNGEIQTADIKDTELYTVDVNEGGTAKGEYDVILKLVDSGNYKWSITDDAKVTLKFMITNAENSWTTEPSIMGWTYGEDANAPVSAAKFGPVKVLYTGTANDGTEWNSAEAPLKAGKYKAVFTVEATADYSGLQETVDFAVAKREVTISAKPESSKVYDGTTDAKLSECTINNILTADDIKIDYSNARAAYSDKNAGNSKVVTFNGFAITGSDVDNYILAAQPENESASITKKTVTATATAADKVYDGTVNADKSKVEITFDGILGDETVGYEVTDAYYDDAGAKENHTVHIGFSVTGDDAENYAFPENGDYAAPEYYVEAKADILKRELTILVEVADKQYDGLNTAAIVSSQLNNVVEGDKIELINGTATFAQVNPGEDIGISFTDFAISAEKEYLLDYYTLIQPTGVTASIINNWTPVEYSVTEANGNGWLKDIFEIKAKEGYLVSTTNIAEGIWNETLTYDAETAEGSVSFYVKNVETGAISLAAAESYKLDKTVPAGSVEFVQRKEWQEFVNVITFGLFFKEEVTVKAAADDTLSGVASVEYAVSDKPLTLEEVKDLTDWTVMPERGVAVELEDAKQFVYFVRITDKAGNVAYISTDGAVYDTQAPVISGITDGSIYYTTQDFTVTETNLEEVTVNESLVDEAGYTLAGDTEAVYTIIATDKAGNSVTVKVTMKTITSIGENIKDLTTENVTADDKDAIQAVEELLASVDTTNAADDEKDAVKDMLDKIKELLGEIEKNEQALEDALDLSKDINSENYDVDSKEILKETAGKLEEIVDKNNKNYTKAEKERAQEELDRVNELIDSIEEVEDVLSKIKEAESMIGVIGDATMIPDDMHAVHKAVEAKQAYEVLDDKEKTLIGDEKTQLLTELYEKAVDFQIIKGADGMFTKGSGKGLSFTANGAFGLFKAVKVDGKVIDAENYMAKAGSTVIELKAEYLQTLNDGSHTFEVVYEVLEEEYSADCNFTVKKATVSNITSGTSSPGAPDTGDHSNVFGVLGTMIASAMTIFLILFGKRRRI